MVKDHSDSEKGNPLRPHGLLFPISSTVHREDELCNTNSMYVPHKYYSSQVATEPCVKSMYYFNCDNQCSTTGLAKGIVCTVLSVRWCIYKRHLAAN